MPAQRGDGRRVVWAVTDASTADAFLQPHLRMLKEQGDDVWLVARRGDLLHRVARETGARPLGLRSLRRPPRPGLDLLAMLEATVALRRLRPDVVCTTTPKAGLVLGLAAWLIRVPTRIYTLAGLRYETAEGWGRKILVAAERMACRASTRVLAVSESLRQVAIQDGLAPPEKISVPGNGSLGGVDLRRFGSDEEARREFRAQHRIDTDDPLVLFVGRLAADKGVADLAQAWGDLAKPGVRGTLAVVGGIDATQPAPDEALRRLQGCPSVRMVGELADTRSAFAAADLLILPTYREGFPTVVIEAAAAGVPTVGYDVTGVRDAVDDGVTGILVPPRSVSDLALVIEALLRDCQRRRALGENARSRASLFDEHVVVASYLREIGS